MSASLTPEERRPYEVWALTPRGVRRMTEHTERVIDARVEQALRQHRLDWAAHIEAIASAVSPTAHLDRPEGFAETAAMIADALRAETPPFGVAQGSPDRPA